MARPAVLLALLVALLASCSQGGVEDYYEQMAEIGRDQDARSAAIVAPGTAPTRTQIIEIVDLRREGLADLQAIEPPEEVAGLHAEFVDALATVVALADDFLADATGLDAGAFIDALAATTEIDEAQRRFTAFCRTLEIEADGLGVGPVDLSC